MSGKKQSKKSDSGYVLRQGAYHKALHGDDDALPIYAERVAHGFERDSPPHRRVYVPAPTPQILPSPFYGQYMWMPYEDQPSPTDFNAHSPLSDSEASAVPIVKKEDKAEKEKRTYNERWQDAETEVLVSLWKENYASLKSSKGRVKWMEIGKIFQETTGCSRSVAEMKAKIHNLCTKYKSMKDKETGGLKNTFPFYNDIDSMIGKPDKATLSEVQEVGLKRGVTIIDDDIEDVEPNDNDSHSDAESPVTDINSEAYIDQLVKLKKVRNDVKMDERKNKRRKVESITEVLTMIHNEQMIARERSEKRYYEFMEKLVENQEKRNEEREEKDRKFWLEMVKVLK